MSEKRKGCPARMRSGLLDGNPVFVQLLGLCPALAITTSVMHAVGMGLATMAVLICSNLLISLLRKFIPKQVRIAAYLVIIAGLVTSVELLMKAYFPALDRALGLFVPLIAVNCLILARAEEFASKNGPIASVADGLLMGLGFAAALILIAAVRELLGAGSICGIPLFGAAFKPAILFILPPGAFLTLGFLLAAVQKMTNSRAEKRSLCEDKAEEEADA